MKHSAYIYNELKEVSPFLAEMEKANVFSVPEKYFEALTNQILQRTADPFFALPASEPHFSGVPEGYFENLSGNILNKIKRLESDDALEELRVLSPLLYAAQNENVFSIPKGYFESLPANILNKIKRSESDDAFEELRELSPMLYAVQNENVFSVPAGYFENLPGVILDMVQPQAKVVTLKKRSVIWKYALAAMLTGVIAVSGLWVTNNKSSQQTAAITKIKTIPPYIKDAKQYKNEQQIDEGIANLDDADIIKYLETTGNNTDDDLLATSVQENDLPAEEDYLLNDKALDTYLNETDIKPNQN